MLYHPHFLCIFKVYCLIKMSSNRQMDQLNAWFLSSDQVLFNIMKNNLSTYRELIFFSSTLCSLYDPESTQHNNDLLSHKRTFIYLTELFPSSQKPCSCIISHVKKKKKKIPKKQLFFNQGCSYNVVS